MAPFGLTVSKWLVDACYKSSSDARASSFPLEHSIVVGSELAYFLFDGQQGMSVHDFGCGLLRKDG